MGCNIYATPVIEGLIGLASALYTNPTFGHLREPDMAEGVAAAATEVAQCQTRALWNDSFTSSDETREPAHFTGILQQKRMMVCVMSSFPYLHGIIQFCKKAVNLSWSWTCARKFMQKMHKWSPNATIV